MRCAILFPLMTTPSLSHFKRVLAGFGAVVFVLLAMEFVLRSWIATPSTTEPDPQFEYFQRPYSRQVFSSEGYSRARMNLLRLQRRGSFAPKAAAAGPDGGRLLHRGDASVSGPELWQHRRVRGRRAGSVQRGALGLGATGYRRLRQAARTRIRPRCSDHPAQRPRSTGVHARMGDPSPPDGRRIPTRHPQESRHPPTGFTVGEPRRSTSPPSSPSSRGGRTY